MTDVTGKRLTDADTAPPENGVPAAPATGPRRFLTALAEPGVTLLLAVFALFYASTAAYRQDYVVLICTYALLALGMYVPYMMAGGLSLAYNAYLSIGAYLAGIAVVRWHTSSLWGLPTGFVLSAVVAVLLGIVTSKLSGFYLAGVTLLFATAYQSFIGDADGITGGANGMVIEPPTFFGSVLGRSALVTLSVALVWFVGMFLSRLRRSPFGVAVRIKREAPQVVEASGVSSATVVLVSLGIGAGIAALGGAMFGLMNGVVQPESFDLSLVFLAIFMPLLGGRNTPWGAVLGAVIVVVFTFQLDWFASSGTLVFSLALLVILRFAPQGLLGFGVDGYHWIRRRGWRSVR